MMRRTLVTLGLAICLAASGLVVLAPRSGAAIEPPGVPNFAHIYQIVFENQGPSAIVGSASAPYLNQLIGQYGLATNYDAVAHPSEPNYLAMFSGSTQGVTDDGIHSFAGTNLADQIETAGRTWRVFAENVPLGCSTVATASDGEDGPGTYARKHEPAISFSDISDNPARCTDITDFSHFNAATADYELIVPNLCNDMHDCPVSSGDAWLQSWLPAHILGTPTWQNTDSLLLITWDEGVSNLGGGGPVTTIVVSKHTPSGFTSATPHTHYSLLRTIEDAWNLGCLNQSCAANDLAEFFAPSPPVQPVAVSIPGQIQAENYLPGGQGVGYYDTTPGNAGNAYRHDDVDIQACSDPTPPAGTTCYNVGWIATGEWLAYEVNAPLGAFYSFSFRVAAPAQGARLHLDIDGSNVSGSVDLPQTGGWQTWTSVATGPIWISAGTHQLKVVADTRGYNFDYVDASLAFPAWFTLFGSIATSTSR